MEVERQGQALKSKRGRMNGKRRKGSRACFVVDEHSARNAARTPANVVKLDRSSKQPQRCVPMSPYCLCAKERRNSVTALQWIGRSTGGC